MQTIVILSAMTMIVIQLQAEAALLSEQFTIRIRAYRLMRENYHASSS